MAVFLERVEEGRYVSEYSRLMATELKLSNPQVSAELSSRGSNAGLPKPCATQSPAAMSVSEI